MLIQINKPKYLWPLHPSRTEGKVKQPYYIRFNGSRLFALAGLLEHWQDKTKEDILPIEPCTILTTAENELMEPIHHRMPVILDESTWESWLDPEITEPEALDIFLKPFPSQEMEAFPVCTMVNEPRNDRAECVEAV